MTLGPIRPVGAGRAPIVQLHAAAPLRGARHVRAAGRVRTAAVPTPDIFAASGRAVARRRPWNPAQGLKRPVGKRRRRGISWDAPDVDDLSLEFETHLDLDADVAGPLDATDPPLPFHITDHPKLTTHHRRIRRLHAQVLQQAGGRVRTPGRATRALKSYLAACDKLESRLVSDGGSTEARLAWHRRVGERLAVLCAGGVSPHAVLLAMHGTATGRARAARYDGWLGTLGDAAPVLLLSLAQQPELLGDALSLRAGRSPVGALWFALQRAGRMTSALRAALRAGIRAARGRRRRRAADAGGPDGLGLALWTGEALADAAPGFVGALAGAVLSESMAVTGAAPTSAAVAAAATLLEAVSDPDVAASVAVSDASDASDASPADVAEAMEGTEFEESFADAAEDLDGPAEADGLDAADAADAADASDAADSAEAEMEEASGTDALEGSANDAAEDAAETDASGDTGDSDAADDTGDAAEDTPGEGLELDLPSPDTVDVEEAEPFEHAIPEGEGDPDLDEETADDADAEPAEAEPDPDVSWSLLARQLFLEFGTLQPPRFPGRASGTMERLVDAALRTPVLFDDLRVVAADLGRRPFSALASEATVRRIVTAAETAPWPQDASWRRLHPRLRAGVYVLALATQRPGPVAHKLHVLACQCATGNPPMVPEVWICG